MYACGQESRDTNEESGINAQHHRLLWFLPAITVMTVIFFLSAKHRVPTAGLDAGLVAAAGHLIAYGCLALALRLGLEKYGFDMRAASRLAILLALLYGASDELHQTFVPGRHADPIDLFLDFTGAVVGNTIFGLLWKAPQRRRI